VHRFLKLVLLMSAGASATPLNPGVAAQQVPADQIILGRLIDDATRSPVSGGTIRLLRADSSVVLSVIADSAGRFRIATRRTGPHRLRAEHIAYQTATSPEIVLVLRDTIRLDFHVMVGATLLSPIVVRAERTLAHYYAARGMEDFYRRMMTAGFRSAFSGQFLTRDSIEAWWEGTTTTHMMTQFRGVNVSGDGIFMRNCAPRLFVDGVEYQLMGQRLNDAFPPHLLEAVEVYVGAAVPGEFFGRSCGVVVLWRRR
jgi:hypothetical protein